MLVLNLDVQNELCSLALNISLNAHHKNKLHNVHKDYFGNGSQRGQMNRIHALNVLTRSIMSTWHLCILNILNFFSHVHFVTSHKKIINPSLVVSVCFYYTSYFSCPPFTRIKSSTQLTQVSINSVPEDCAMPKGKLSSGQELDGFKGLWTREGPWVSTASLCLLDARHCTKFFV